MAKKKEENAILGGSHELFCILNNILESSFQPLGLHFVPGQE